MTARRGWQVFHLRPRDRGRSAVVGPLPRSRGDRGDPSGMVSPTLVAVHPGTAAARRGRFRPL